MLSPHLEGLHTMRAALVAVLAGLMLASTAAASNPTNGGTPVFNHVTTWTQGCNDLQSSPPAGSGTGGPCVTDTVTGYGVCTWGDEDDIADFALGKITGGVTITDTLCLVTDWCSDGACPHKVLYQVDDSSPALDVWLTDDRGNTWTAPPIRLPKNGGYRWQLCFADPLWPAGSDPLLYPPLPGTNGGRGYVTAYTLHVTATKTTQMDAGLEIAQNRYYGYVHTFADVPCPVVN
jgi:hypothetical protein